jgi:Protein of unknown function (DUF3781)
MNFEFKKTILQNICFTDLVYARINKKLNINLSKAEIELLIVDIINKSADNQFEKKGKNIYITSDYEQVRLTINSFTNRIITADKLK